MNKNYLALSLSVLIITGFVYISYLESSNVRAQTPIISDMGTESPTNTSSDTGTNTPSYTTTPTETTSGLPTYTTTPGTTVIITPPVQTIPPNYNSFRIEYDRGMCSMSEPLTVGSKKYILLDPAKYNEVVVSSIVSLDYRNKLNSNCSVTITANVPDEIKYPKKVYTETCKNDQFCIMHISLNNYAAMSTSKKYNIDVYATASPECNIASNKSQIKSSFGVIQLALDKSRKIFEFGGTNNGQFPSEYSKEFISKIVGQNFKFVSWRSKVSMDIPYKEIKEYATTNLYDLAANQFGLKISAGSNDVCTAYPKVMIAGFSMGGARAILMSRELAKNDKIRTNTVFAIDPVPASYNGSGICTQKFLAQGTCVLRNISYYQHEDSSFSDVLKWWMQWGKRGRAIEGGTKNIGVTAETLSPEKAAAGVIKWQTTAGIGITPSIPSGTTLTTSIIKDNFHELMLSDKNIMTSYANEIKSIISGTETSYLCSGVVPDSEIEGGLPGMGGNTFGGIKSYIWGGDH